MGLNEGLIAIGVPVSVQLRPSSPMKTPIWIVANIQQTQGLRLRRWDSRSLEGGSGGSAGGIFEEELFGEGMVGILLFSGMFSA